MECGRKVFDEMPDRNVISWMELISAYGKSGDVESARKLFDRLFDFIFLGILGNTNNSI